MLAAAQHGVVGDLIDQALRLRPRPERPEFVKVLAEKIPYYRQRLGSMHGARAESLDDAGALLLLSGVALLRDLGAFGVLGFVAVGALAVAKGLSTLHPREP